MSRFEREEYNQEKEARREKFRKKRRKHSELNEAHQGQPKERYQRPNNHDYESYLVDEEEEDFWYKE